MPACKSVYDPQEDSTVLERYVRKYARGRVLDMGTGSGIQAIAASQNKNVRSVIATDILKGVIDYCKRNIQNHRIRFLQSNLFQNIKGKFDTIIFNPPYLPQELKLKDLTIEGGKKGYETIEKFLNNVNDFLESDGLILLIFSSLTKKEKVEEFIRKNLLEFEELEKIHIFFEDIYVYLLSKNVLLKELESRDITNIRYLAKGRRGLIFTGLWKNKKITIKTKNPQSKAIGRIENESKWLRMLNKHNIGPKLIFEGTNYFAYGYVDGAFIVDYIKKYDRNKIKKAIENLFNQLFVLDKLKIEKEEMHHPFKHIIVERNKPCLIDFERMHYSQHPKNVTQFCQFLTHSKMFSLLKSKQIPIDKKKLLELAKIYKKSPSEDNFKKIAGIV